MPRMVATDHDLPAGLTVRDVDWPASMARLSELATNETGRVYCFSYHDLPGGSVSIGSTWELEPAGDYTEAERRHINALCRDHRSWVVRRGSATAC